LLNNGDAYEAIVLARDTQLDIAILQINEPLKRSLTYANFANSESLQLGEKVVAIGNALGEFRNSVSVGVISGLSRTVIASDSLGNSEQLDQVIQTDAAINPGNSGGPLLNVSGEVVGVNVATSRGADNIGFALPAHEVANIVHSVQTYGEIIRPLLGVRYVTVDSRTAEQYDLPVSYGALVTKGSLPGEDAVLSDSPAERAGIQSGDVLLSVDGESLQNTQLAALLRRKSVGQIVEIVLFRDGVEKLISLQLDKAL
jgi:serine protease Do